jgi:fatty-acyl-CoA synthase
MNALAQSYVHGASAEPLIGETIGVLLDRIAAEAPDSPALVMRHQKIRWNYRQLRERVDDLAAGLIALGLKVGDRIGIWSPNNAEWVLTHRQGRPDPCQYQSRLPRA